MSSILPKWCKTYPPRVRSADSYQNPLTEKAHKRVHNLATNEILAWADTCGAGVNRALSDYQRHTDYDSLEDAYAGLLTMLGVIEELRERPTKPQA